MNELYDTVIVGSGPAGLTAGIYNLRAGLKTLVISGNQPGGQLIITTMVDNYPGFPNGVGGVKLMMDMQSQFKNLGGTMIDGVVNNLISESVNKNFEIQLNNGEKLNSKSIIIATGAAIKWLGLPNEKELIGKGISGCATCDGMFFRGKIVAIIGGGDTACEEADFLSRLANKVYLVHRRDKLKASAVEQEKVLNNPKIEMVWNSEVDEIIGTEKLTAIKLNTGKTLEIDGMFVAIGYKPATDFVKGLVEIDDNGHIVVGKNEQFKTMTTVEGIFAAGDCVNANHRQAIIAAGDGCRAGLDAEKWVRR
jgi:thioredoxin reductase (NADPH)